jgi:hypothetical protein
MEKSRGEQALRRFARQSVDARGIGKHGSQEAEFHRAILIAAALERMKTPLKTINQIGHITLDLGTIPNRALSEPEPAVQEYIKRKFDKLRASDPSLTYENFASLNPRFGRIICRSWGCGPAGAESTQCPSQSSTKTPGNGIGPSLPPQPLSPC